jgi:hypothetical protein
VDEQRGKLVTVATLTLSELRGLRDGLVRARGQGVRHVVYESNSIRREIEYRSDQELRQALGDCQQQIAAAEGRSSVNVVAIRSTKGFL